MQFIGITGGIGAGKSAVLDYIRKHYKCEIYLADQVAHDVKEPGQPCYRQLVELLGKEILDSEGRIDRAVMASHIFKDGRVLAQVNDIVHPAVQQYLCDKLKKAAENPETQLFFVEAALLIETGYKELVDEMWYIYAGEEIRRKRLAESRGYTPDKITQIMEKQLSDEVFRQSCDFVIDNSGSLEASCRQIDRKLEAFTWQE